MMGGRATEASRGEILGRLVLEGGVVAGRIEVEGSRISAVAPDDRGSDGPYLAPGFVDVHCHGWGGHDAMGDEAALNGMARALLPHGVTSFLPTAVTAPMSALTEFAGQVRRWSSAGGDPEGADGLGFNIEGPFISAAKKGAQNPDHIADPAAVTTAELEPLLDGLRIMTVAPERAGALEVIRWLASRGVQVSLGHSNATAAEAAAGYEAGGRTTTHLFNAMSGVDNHPPGLAVTALADDGAYAELVADGFHVERALWPVIVRSKPADRLVLVSDAVSLAGTGDGRTNLGGMEVEVRDMQCRLVSDGRLAGSVIALDSAVRNLARSGIPLHAVVRAASRNPLELIGVTDRGRIAPGQLADLVELDEELQVTRVMKSGRWHAGPREGGTDGAS
jgi:N-acetylglucosamine-6-phosphate deacetylase